MNHRLFRLRRMGVAAIAGVTALGAASFLGGGVAEAAVTNVSAFTLTASTYATSTVANWTAAFLPANALAANGTITLTIGGTATGTEPTVPAAPAVTLGSNFANCTATAVGTAAVTGSSAAKVVVTLAGATCAVTANVPTSLTINGITNVTTPATGVAGAALGTIATSADTGVVNAANTISYTLPAVTVSTTPVKVTVNTTNNAANPVTINVPTADLSTFTTNTANDVVPVVLTLGNASGNYFNVTSGEPTVVQTNGAATNTAAATPAVVSAVDPQLALTGTAATTSTTANSSTTTTASAANPTGVVQGDTFVFGVSGQNLTQPLSFTISNLHVDGAAAATVTLTVSAGTPVAPSALGAITGYTINATASGLGTATLYTVGTPAPTAIAGSTATATSALEFEQAFYQAPSATTPTPHCGTTTAVIATSASYSDALSASYLEGLLNTGVLITPATTAGPDMLAALKTVGISSVYVVGGPLAVSQSVISTLQSTPVYSCGGAYATSAKIQVFGPIYGQTASDTAVAIDNYVATTLTGNLKNASGTSVSVNAAYGAATATAGGGLYNQTTGNSSATGPTAAASSVATAIVVSNTDYQDVMAAAGLAYRSHLPIVETSASSLDPAASAELVKLGIGQVIALGGNLALSNSVVTSIQAQGIPVLRIAGADYTQTAADIAQFEGAQLGWASSTVLVAQGAYWTDALAAAPLSAGWNQTAGTTAATPTSPEAMLLTLGPTKGVGSFTDAALKLAGTSPSGLGGGVTTTIQVLGGALAVPASQITEMQAALG